MATTHITTVVTVQKPSWLLRVALIRAMPSSAPSTAVTARTSGVLPPSGSTRPARNTPSTAPSPPPPRSPTRWSWIRQPFGTAMDAAIAYLHPIRPRPEPASFRMLGPEGSWTGPPRSRMLPGENMAPGRQQVKRLTRGRQDRCAHEMKVSVEVAGLERSVCSECGLVSFSTRGELTSEVARDRFARRADEFGGADLEGLIR